MDYTSIEGPSGVVLRIPAEHTDDEDRRTAHEWLLQLARPHYNRMLAAERDGKIPEALREAEAAVQHGAYAPRVVTGAFLIAAKHGEFDLARRLLERIRAFGLGDTDEYEALLRRRVERWNTFLENTGALREAYQEPGVTLSYRELLLLSDRLDEQPTKTELAHLRAVGLAAVNLESPEVKAAASASAETSSTFSPVTRLAPALVLACLLGIGLGGSGTYFMSNGFMSNGSASNAPASRGEESMPETAEPSSPAVPDSLAPRDQYRSALRVGTLLAERRPVEAHGVLGRFAPGKDVPEQVDSLRVATHEALYRAGARAWEAKNYERVVRALTPIRNAEVGSMQDRRYRLGLAAAQTGRDTLAVGVLQDLMPTIDERHPHYEAQAAYLLAERGPPEVASRYARLIADRYDDTLYFNSVVRARLENTDKS